MSTGFADWLIGHRVLSEGTVRAAVARQAVYGGTLDTAILEMGAMSESAIWARLGAATGLPIPAPALCDGHLAETPPRLGPERTGPLRTVPVAAEAGTLKLLCADPVAADEIRAAVVESGFAAKLYVVPEVRLLAARQRAYGEPMPARYAPLLARIIGAARVRKNYFAPRPQSSRPSSPKDVGPDRTKHEDAAASSSADAAPTETSAGAPTPLEHLLDLSGPMLLDSSLDQLLDLSGPMPPDSSLDHPPDLSGPMPPDSSLEAEIIAEDGAQPSTPMADPPLSPVRLDVRSAPAVPGDRMSSSAASTEPDPAAPEPVTDTATESLCRRARDPQDRGRPMALRALRLRLTHPAVEALLDDLRATATGGDAALAIDAIDALAELRDESMIPTLIQGLDRATPPDVAAAVHRALIALAAQDFGRSRRRWQLWAKRNARRPRTEWLLDGLGHKEPPIRMAAAEELRQLSGESFGYLFDLPKRQREDARRRWIAWWRETGQQTTPTARA